MYLLCTIQLLFDRCYFTYNRTSNAHKCTLIKRLWNTENEASLYTFQKHGKKYDSVAKVWKARGKVSKKLSNLSQSQIPDDDAKYEANTKSEPKPTSEFQTLLNEINTKLLVIKEEECHTENTVGLGVYAQEIS